VTGTESKQFRWQDVQDRRRLRVWMSLNRGDAVKLDRQELVRVLRTEGDNHTAAKFEAGLPDEIDTDRDADALEGAGLDRTQLMAKLAGGGLGGTVAP
jgi:hypothetical protein